MELFAKIVNGRKRLTNFAKSSILDVELVSEYVSTYSFPGMFYILGGSFAREKLGKLKNEFLQMFGETSRSKISHL